MAILIPYRFPAWLALSLFSLVTILAILDERDRNWHFEAKWSIALASISFGLSTLLCIGQLIQDVRQKIASTKTEGILIMILIVVWCLANIVIMSPGNGLALLDSRIVDANLYFASWAAFACALYIFASYGHSTGRLDTIFASRWWLCLLISSIITLSAALRLKSNLTVCLGSGRREQCRELRLGIALSAFSVAICAGVILLAYIQSSLSEYAGWIGLGASLLVALGWGFCVAFLTFDNGPGSNVGNLFFGTWVSFVLALHLALTHMQVAMASTTTTSSSTSAVPATSTKAETKKKAKKGDQPEEAIP